VPRDYFGTDGVRGVVGEFITADLVERLGKASALWCGSGCRVFIGRDTRGSSPELEEAFARGVASAGGHAVLAGVVPTPAVALLRLDLGVVISASHNPPEYNGVKFFDRQGRKLSDEQEEQIEALLDANPLGGGTIAHVDVAADSYLEHVVERFGTDLSGMRIAVDCANGAYAGLAPRAFEQLGAEVVAMANEPNGRNINVRCGATDMRALQGLVRGANCDIGIAFDGDGDRMLAVDAQGEIANGDEIVAILAFHLNVDLVAVTSMSNLGLHKLLSEHGIRVLTTDVGDRYVLEALYREGGILGAEQSGHIICLRDHVTGDGLAAGLLLCGALEGHPLHTVRRAMIRYPQVTKNLPRADRRPLPQLLLDQIDALNADLGDEARVLVRPSGTEPLVRILTEASTLAEAEDLCATVAALVTQELG
jgi:phosphoglucosamine mutase